VHTDPAAIYRLLADLDRPCHVVRTEQGVGLTADAAGYHVLATVDALPPQRLGAARYLAEHGTGYAYQAGAMAGGIASEELVRALRTAGFQASFGAAGLPPERVAEGLRRLGDLPFACNLIHSPHEPRLEDTVVDLCLRHGVRCVEASAFMDLRPSLVRYRAIGLRRGADGAVEIGHRVIAKVSRPELAAVFLQPPPDAVVEQLVRGGGVSAEQAALAREVPIADDITVEADSGGHTDNQSLTAVLPAVLALRGRATGRSARVRVGAAGGLGTPRALAAAFALGADYVVTGSVNQSCVESGTSDRARELLAATGINDTRMAPAADMFEMGVQLQVLSRGSMFPMRARKLYELFRAHDSLADLPADDLRRVEEQYFRRSAEDVWQDCVGYFAQRDPDMLARAEREPKRRMALVFRWYLAMASRWATEGAADRTADYQIWCGPAMGSFNDWVAGSHLEPVGNRHAADVAWNLMRGAAFHSRLWQLGLAGVRLPAACTEYRPEPMTTGEAR
jgi:PfaD family protein